MLSWTLTICTYNRPHFLVETLRHALAQTRLPAEIVVVDGSDDWQTTRQTMQEAFAADWANVRLVYEPAKVRSLTFQRNQALGLATSDIVFSLDDDIYLYPDAAEIVMRGYEADQAEEIAMIAGQFTPGPYVEHPPQTEPIPEAPKTPSLAGRLRMWMEDQLSLAGHFVPYDAPVARQPAPATLNGMNILPVGLINGGRTTFRRKFAVDSGWSELLRYYATHEDSDFSYRLSRRGQLLVAPDAGFFHADGNEGTTSRFRVNSIRVRNLMALHRVHSPNCLRSAARLSASFLKFFLMYLLIDAAQKRLTLPTVRAYAFGLVQVPVFMFWPFADFERWYNGLQEKMYGNRYK